MIQLISIIHACQMTAKEGRVIKSKLYLKIQCYVSIFTFLYYPFLTRFVSSPGYVDLHASLNFLYCLPMMNSIHRPVLKIIQLVPRALQSPKGVRGVQCGSAFPCRENECTTNLGQTHYLDHFLYILGTLVTHNFVSQQMAAIDGVDSFAGSLLRGWMGRQGHCIVEA